MEAIGPLLTGIVIGVVAAVGGLVYWDRRKADEDMTEAAGKSSGGKGEEK